MKKNITVFLTALIISSAVMVTVSVVPVFLQSRPGADNSPQQDIQEYMRLFSDAFTIIRDNYVDEMPVKDIIYGAIDGMIGVLDDYSQFMEPKRADRIREDSEGEFGGLGIRITKEGEYIKVITPMPETPAYRKGILPGDLIIEIDGEAARGISMEDAVNKLRGPEGTEVTISIRREGEGELIKYTIVRDTIVPRKVFGRMINPDIAYVRLTDFSGNAPEMFKETLQDKLNGGAASFILDLRNNPGGLLKAAIEISEMFLSRGDLVVYTKGRAPNQSREFHSRSRPVAPEIPMIILINRGSASGSEIVAGSLQDHGRAILLGEKTFGKASVQSIINLEDGSSLRLTTAEYFTPGGNPIHGEGVSPDIEVKLTTEEKRLMAEERYELYTLSEEERVERESEIRDPQLDRAVDIMRARAIFMRGNKD